MQTAYYRLILVSCFLMAALVSKAQPYHYYFGNIHAHTIYSDGAKDGAQTKVLTPADCYKFAKSSQHFDFLGISEHNHSGAKMHLSSYAKGLAQADAATENGKFVCLYGMEYGVINNGGHVVIYGFDKLIGWEHGNYDIFSEKFDYESLFKIIARNPKAFATLAHPSLTDYSQLISKPYDPVTDEAVTGVAISSGPAFSTKTDYSDRAPLNYYSYYKKLLSRGYIVGPVMDHDNHYTSFGRMSTTRTVLLSRQLSRDSLTAAYKQNRFYASEDWDTQVNFTINSQPMGSYLVNSSALQIKAVVLDPDVADHVKTIKLWFGKPGSGEQAKTLKVADRQNELSTVFNLQTGDDYYFFLEITQEDGDRIITSPIWASHGSNSRSAIAMQRLASAPPAMIMQPGPVDKSNFTGKHLLAQKSMRKPNKTHLNMNPQIIFWITFGILTISVAYCSRKYCMLKDSGKSARKPFSWSRVQLAWWTIILLSAFISVLFYYNQALTFSESAVILLGISAATTATARVIDVSDAENPLVTSRTQDTEGSNLVLDILSDKNGVSINRFQTVVFNFAFGCWFIYSILKNLTTLPEDGIDAILPEISTNNLVLLGLSSATYAAMKATENKSTSPGSKDGSAAAPDSTNIEEQPVG